MSNQTLLIIAIALLGAIFLMLTKCAFLLDRAAKAARPRTATMHIDHPTSLGLRGGGGGGGVASSPSAKLRTARARVHDAETALRAAKGRLTEVENETSAPAEAAATSVASAHENYAADKKLRDDEHATLKSFDPRLRLGDLTPVERADMSRKVAKIRVNTVLDARSTIATAIKTMPFEPEHIEALVKLHNALGVAVRDFDASIKAAPSNADTFGLQS